MRERKSEKGVFPPAVSAFYRSSEDDDGEEEGRKSMQS